MSLRSFCRGIRVQQYNMPSLGLFYQLITGRFFRTDHEISANVAKYANKAYFSSFVVLFVGLIKLSHGLMKLTLYGTSVL